MSPVVGGLFAALAVIAFVFIDAVWPYFPEIAAGVIVGFILGREVDW